LIPADGFIVTDSLENNFHWDNKGIILSSSMSMPDSHQLKYPAKQLKTSQQLVMRQFNILVWRLGTTATRRCSTAVEPATLVTVLTHV